MCDWFFQKDLEEETIYEQFLIVKALTVKSDVHEYGQLASVYENNDIWRKNLHRRVPFVSTTFHLGDI